MNCQFLEKISLLIDGELPSDEIQSVKTHLNHCEHCLAAQRDFLFLRQEIKDTSLQVIQVDRRSGQKKNKVIDFIWSRRISLPIPVFGSLILILVGIGGWNVLSRLERSSDTVINTAEQQSSLIEANQPKIPGSSSLAKFDHGGRTEIYVLQNQNTTGRDK